MKPTLYLAALFLFTTIACSPHKAFESGNYEIAYKRSLAKVKKHKANASTKQLFVRSLNELNKTDLAKIEHGENSTSPMLWEKTLLLYKTLLERNKTARHFLPQQVDFDLDFYKQKHHALRQKAADYFVEKGKNKMEKTRASGIKHFAQLAYDDFQKATSFAGNNKEIAALKKEAIAEGKVYYHIASNTDFNLKKTQELAKRLNRSKSRFKQFLSGKSNDDLIDCSISINISQVRFSETSSTETESFSKEVIEKYNTVVDTCGTETKEPVYKTIHGSIHKTTFTKSAELNVCISTKSSSKNCNFESRSFSITEVDEDTEIKTSGDQDALPIGVHWSPVFLDSDAFLEQKLRCKLDDEIYNSLRW